MSKYAVIREHDEGVLIQFGQDAMPPHSSKQFPDVTAAMAAYPGYSWSDPVAGECDGDVLKVGRG